MPYSATTWVDGVTKLGPTNLNKIETELARLKTNADLDAAAAITYSKLSLASSIVSADIVDGTLVNADINAAAAIVGSKLATGLTGPPGTELVYTELTSDATFTATTFAGATTLLTAGAFTFDGATACIIEVFSPHITTISSNTVFLTLWDGSTDLGILGKLGSSAGGVIEAPFRTARRLTPSNAAHTFSVRGVLNSAGTGTFGAGAGGTGGIYLPAYIRITKV